MKKDFLYTLAKVFSTFGILLALYIIYQQITQSGSAFCNISESINCDAIISGELSKTFGIPTPLIGLIGYIFILYGSIKRIPKLMLYMSTFGFLFCGWIGYREFFELRVLCTLCIGCHVSMIGVFITSILLNIKRKNISN